jgi:uncharacterized protein (AIM24 family)
VIVARVVRFPVGDGEAVDEFRYQLQRGGEHLARGEAEAARIALRRASEMRPDDPKMLGLLGQAAYRMGDFGEAAEAYGRLVQQTPSEPRAQVNLGLALLKAGRAAEAIAHLERALDLSPEHRRAMGYLGLAWLEQGNVARARSWFERGGREQMVRRCDVLLRAERRNEKLAPPVAERPVRSAAKTPRLVGSEPRAAEKAARPAPSAPRPAAPEERPAEREPRQQQRAATELPRAPAFPPLPPTAPLEGWRIGAPPAMGGRSDAAIDRELQDVLRMLDEYAVGRARTSAGGDPPGSPEGPPPAPGRPGIEDPPSGEPAVREPPARGPQVREPPAREPPPTPPRAPPRGGLGCAHLLAPAGERFDAGRVLQIQVAGEVLVRRRGLVAVHGPVELVPEAKRRRGGRAAEEPFGSGAAALQRARGEGALLFGGDGRRYTALELGGAALELREAAVFAFDAGLPFENRTLAGQDGPDVELVKLSGDGAVLVASAGELAAVDVAEERPLRVAVAALVGWSGALTVRLAPLLGPRGAADAVELSGHGRVFLDPGAPLA